MINKRKKNNSGYFTLLSKQMTDFNLAFAFGKAICKKTKSSIEIDHFFPTGYIKIDGYTVDTNTGECLDIDKPEYIMKRITTLIY